MAINPNLENSQEVLRMGDLLGSRAFVFTWHKWELVDGGFRLVAGRFFLIASSFGFFKMMPMFCALVMLVV